MKILNKKILNKAATFLLTAVLLCWNTVQVEAASITTSSWSGYPIEYDNLKADFCYSDNLNTFFDFDSILYNSNNNLYTLSYNFDGNRKLKRFYLTNLDEPFNFAYREDCNYYISGLIGFDADVSFTFEPFYTNSSIGLDVAYRKYDVGKTYYLFCTNNADFSLGYVDLEQFRFDITSDLSLSGNHELYLSLSLIEVPKDSEYDVADVLDKLDTIIYNQNTINNSINSNGSSIVSSINQHDANEKSWFQQLIQSMGVGFSTLYKQMTEEKDEQLYGYHDTTTSEAASVFSSESDKLTALEGELSTQSNTYVTDYAAEGFDLGVLATIGSSLIFVTTWFTNFWNIGGVFTACLNFCFALSIVFFILRIKR